MAAAVEGAQVDFDNAIEIEGRYFVDLATGPVAKSMIQAFFFDMQAVNGERSRPADIARWQATKAVVLGDGMMGAAIAFVCAKAGIEVVLKDISLEAAQRGKRYSEKLVARGKAEQAVLDRITPTADPADAAGADLVIEAVFEDPAIKTHQREHSSGRSISPGRFARRRSLSMTAGDSSPAASSAPSSTRG
jgi:3-hydroxyacyl-CoA dehydrogenase/enoyl-CoA hydratase/3-hydroxybutyryl-CoA epimerase